MEKTNPDHPDYLTNLREACLFVVKDGLTLELNGDIFEIDGRDDQGREVFVVHRRDRDGSGITTVEFGSADDALDYFYPAVKQESGS